MQNIKSSVLMKNRRLITERKQQGWTQARLAEALGVTTRTVIRWEQGQTMPHPNYQKKLGTLLGKSAEELGLLWDAKSLLTDPAVPKTLGSLTSLLGRAELLMQLKERLLDTDHVALTVLSGLPGIGKTALAVALATDGKVRLCFSDGILWAPLGQQPHVLGQLTHWGRLLGVTPSDVENPESCESWGRALRSAIGTRRMLLIIDDAWTVEDTAALQVGGPRCTTLLTTHQPQVARSFGERRTIVIPPLEEADGLVLLARFIPYTVQQDPERARSLVQTLGGSPLALTLIGKYLASPIFIGHPWPLRAALAQLHDTQERLRLSMPIPLEEDWPTLAETVPLSLYAAIAIADLHLSPQARAALRTLTIFPSKPHSFSEEAALVMSQQSMETLDELWDAGLLEIWESKRYSLHQTVVDYARASIKFQGHNSDWSGLWYKQE